MRGYTLYRKEGETAVVIISEDDDELFYLLSKLHRSRVYWLKQFAAELLEDFFQKSSSGESRPPVREVSTNQRDKK